MITAGKAHRQQTYITRSAWVYVTIASILLVILPFLFRLDGQPHGDWLQFLGRFHPVLLHLPIALILLIPFFEVIGMKDSAFRRVTGFVLRVALLVSLPTLALGYMLAYGAGNKGPTVTRHMIGAIALCIALMLCLLTRAAWAAGRQKRVYPMLLSGTLLALLWTSHQGGSITHGSDYLTHFAPARLRVLLGSNDASVSPNSFYARQIQPTLNAKCLSCHNASNAKADLRLDSYGLLMHGGHDGAIVLPGKPEASMLLHRVTLPASDSHFMPTEGRTPLTSDEIARIRAWILAGASSTATTIPGIKIAEDHPEPPLQPVGDYSSLVPEIQQMQQGQGAKLVPVSSNPSDGLILRTVDIASAFGDAQLASFQRFAPYIVEAELGRTAITDASFDTLKTFVHLRALHLEGTSITGSGLAKLSTLQQLTYLNLSGTNVTAQSISVLKSMPQLRHLYLFNTPVQPDPAPVKGTH